MNLGQPIIQGLFLILGLLVVAVIFLFWLILDLRKKWSAMFGSGAPIEGQLLRELIERVGTAEIRMDAIDPVIEKMGKVCRVSVQKIGFLRFNPFHDTGGDQSFSLALLDYYNNGVIISGLYTREGTRVYAKSIAKGESRQPLSGEEKSVLNQALSTHIAIPSLDEK